MKQRTEIEVLPNVTRGAAMSATRSTRDGPFIDYENIPAPTEGILVTHFITVRSIARSRAFYSEVLGGTGRTGGEPVHRQAGQLVGAG